jgi:hypothetical protein
VLAAIPLVIARCENDVSRSDRLASHVDTAEARLRQEMLRLVDGIKVLNGVWKGRHRVFVFLRSKRENNPAPGSGYAMNSRR